MVEQVQILVAVAKLKCRVDSDESSRILKKSSE